MASGSATYARLADDVGAEQQTRQEIIDQVNNLLEEEFEVEQTKIQAFNDLYDYIEQHLA